MRRILLKTNPNDLSGRMAEQTRDHFISFYSDSKRSWVNPTIELEKDRDGIHKQQPSTITPKDPDFVNNIEEERRGYLIEEAVPNTPLERSEMIRAVIVRTRKELKRDNGMIIRYDDNAAVVIDQEGNPKGT
ncbi:hypothetical protein J1N35_010616 [Gossypium stocksii]|uniref:Uncharacterized protein n=1 Tax=Gossypium stocksii TaxID=47602 RepID=A0A9D3W2P7_9ROSI|nr:hypothetical protein J1N35_010616 [Gossypium stocksii]